MNEIYLANTNFRDYQGIMKEKMKTRLKILLSYHYFSKTPLDELVFKYFGDAPPIVFIDSGAFSAMSQKTEINLTEYIEFLKKFEKIITVCAGLDVIGDAEATYINQQKMLDAGLKPIPTFHVGEDWKWLDKYIEEGYKYIALGGMVPHSKNKAGLVNWMSECFKRSEGLGIRYHGFGMTNWDLIRAFPWGSVDSSSWCSGFRYGQVPLFDEKIGRFYQVALRDIKKSFKYSQIIRSYGFSPNDVALNCDFDRQKIATISALSYIKAEQWLRRRLLRGTGSVSSGSVLRESTGREIQPVQGSTEETLDRGALREYNSMLSDETRRSASDGNNSNGHERCFSESQRAVYLVALPPKETGSEHNPDSQWVGGTQMFESFKEITKRGLDE